MNKVILIGRLGKDPETIDVSGTKKTSFSLATSEKYKKDGQVIEQTEWHNIEAWGKQAEVLDKYLSKGSQIAIEGKLQTRSYEDKSGAKKYYTNIRLTSFEFLGGNKTTSDDSAPYNNDLPF